MPKRGIAHERPLSPAHPLSLLSLLGSLGSEFPLPCILCCWLQSHARGWCPRGDSAHPCELEPCQLPLSRNIYPLCWSCLLIEYLCHGLAVQGGAESRDVAHSPTSQAAVRLSVPVRWDGSVTTVGWQCHHVPPCHVGVSRPPGSSVG